jgi:hypothetical protein
LYNVDTGEIVPRDKIDDLYQADGDKYFISPKNFATGKGGNYEVGFFVDAASVGKGFETKAHCYGFKDRDAAANGYIYDSKVTVGPPQAGRLETIPQAIIPRPVDIQEAKMLACCNIAQEDCSLYGNELKPCPCSKGLLNAFSGGKCEVGVINCCNPTLNDCTKPEYAGFPLCDVETVKQCYNPAAALMLAGDGRPRKKTIVHDAAGNFSETSDNTMQKKFLYDNPYDYLVIRPDAAIDGKACCTTDWCNLCPGHVYAAYKMVNRRYHLVEPTSASNPIFGPCIKVDSTGRNCIEYDTPSQGSVSARDSTITGKTIPYRSPDQIGVAENEWLQYKEKGTVPGLGQAESAVMKLYNGNIFWSARPIVMPQDFINEPSRPPEACFAGNLVNHTAKDAVVCQEKTRVGAFLAKVSIWPSVITFLRSGGTKEYDSFGNECVAASKKVTYTGTDKALIILQDEPGWPKDGVDEASTNWYAGEEVTFNTLYGSVEGLFDLIPVDGLGRRVGEDVLRGVQNVRAVERYFAHYAFNEDVRQYGAPRMAKEVYTYNEESKAIEPSVLPLCSELQICLPGTDSPYTTDKQCCTEQEARETFYTK